MKEDNQRVDVDFATNIHERDNKLTEENFQFSLPLPYYHITMHAIATQCTREQSHNTSALLFSSNFHETRTRRRINIL